MKYLLFFKKANRVLHSRHLGLKINNNADNVNSQTDKIQAQDHLFLGALVLGKHKISSISGKSKIHKSGCISTK